MDCLPSLFVKLLLVYLACNDRDDIIQITQLLENLSALLDTIEPLAVDKVSQRTNYELVQVSAKDTGGTFWCRIIGVFHNASSL